MTEVTYYIKIFIAIIVLVNPIEGVPLFLARTNHLTRDQKINIAKKTSIAVFIVLIVSLFLGRYVLELFGIGIPAFTFAGGIIIFLISLQMVLGTSSGDKSIPNDPASDSSDIAVVPLAIPLLAGPGAISGIILYGSKSKGLGEDMILAVIVLFISISVWLSLNAATKMEKALNETGIKVMTKISGLLVAAIAIQLIFSGLGQLIETMNVK
ncbi:MAG: MarC family protein [Ignavibacteria bacterium]